MLNLLLFMALATSGQAPQITLERVTVHLFLEKSGTWSPDITAIDSFYSWNFEPSGTGIPDDERFNSFLIKVWLSSSSEIYASGEQATVIVTDVATDKIIFQDSIEGIYIDAKGRTVRPFLISDHACAPLQVEVRAGSVAKVMQLPFRCGE